MPIFIFIFLCNMSNDLHALCNGIRAFMKSHLNFHALSLYRSKIILDQPNCFGQVQIVLVGSKLFWLGPNHFGQIQIRLFWTDLYNLDLTKTNWTCLKQLVLDQNYLDSLKSFWIHRRTRHHSSAISGDVFQPKFFSHLHLMWKKMSSDQMSSELFKNSYKKEADGIWNIECRLMLLKKSRLKEMRV